MTVTTLGYFQVSVMGWRSEAALAITNRQLCFSQFNEQITIIELTEILIHLGYFLLQLTLITLRETSHYIKFTQFSRLFCLGKTKYHLNAFLLGITDETACVDNRDFALRVLGVMHAVEWKPLASNCPISLSLSTRFLEQPIVTKSIRFFRIDPTTPS